MTNDQLGKIFILMAVCFFYLDFNLRIRKLKKDVKSLKEKADV
jgi:uncharacterized membrane protein YciS (DUF1049 family)